MAHRRLLEARVIGSVETLKALRKVKEADRNKIQSHGNSTIFREDTNERCYNTNQKQFRVSLMP